MARRVRMFRFGIIGAICAAYAGCAASALASDPLPGDALAPPVNINIVLLYSEYQNDTRYGGQPGDPAGPDMKHDTKIQASLSVARYVRTFYVGGIESGVQVFLPYAAYLGHQNVGIDDLGAAAPGLPSLGPGRIALSHKSGFGQPSFGAFMFPINNAQTGSYFVFGPWIDPPVSSFNKDANLNPNQNVWTFETEFAFRKVLLGTPATRNLTLEFWEENYFYLSNSNSAAPSEVVDADNIPPIYQSLGVTNPVKATSAANATFREQPTTELHVYLPYQIIPATRFYVAPGLYQAFGGKQTYKVNGAVIDSGARTEETQLRLVIASFVSPTVQLTLSGDYDVAAHGIPYNRTLEFRFVKFFR